MRLLNTFVMRAALSVSAAVLVFPHPVMGQMTTPGSTGQEAAISKLAFENAQIMVGVRRVARSPDGAQVRTSLEVKNKTDTPIWVILAAPRASITDEDASVMLAKRITGMMSCDNMNDDWNGAPHVCAQVTKARYTRLEPGVAYPFTMQFIGGTGKEEDKAVRAGALQLTLRLQLVPDINGGRQQLKESTLVDITVRDLQPN